MPLLALLLAVVIDGGLAINSWLRVTTAARDGTRFALDAGRSVDVKDLILTKLPGLDANQINIYIISGKTNSGGNIPCTGCSNWNVIYHYGPGSATGNKVQPDQIRERLRVNSDSSADDNLPFTLVEVDYVYEPFLGKILGNVTIPMSSYAIVEQYGQD
jgi:hypothetical protein